MPADVTIYHNPACSTSRKALELIRAAGLEPQIIEYLKTPPSRATLESLVTRAGLTPRALLREKESAYAELGLGNPDMTDSQLLDAIVAHPRLMNRPLVVSARGVKLCRPVEVVLSLLPEPAASV